MSRQRLAACFLSAVGLIGLLAWRPAPLRGEEDMSKPHRRKPLPTAEEIAKLPPDGGEAFNRLIFERSPYLRQHARNPVDWYPWGDAAFEKARKEGKPVLLSVGYSTCHWCHVMERESFEDARIAAYLNKHFVAIKVDREERPDVDQVYMTALQAMTRSGGWPMNMFLLPDRRPFTGGTYFPPTDRGGRLGFLSVLKKVHALWTKDRKRVLEGAGQLTTMIRARPSVGRSKLGAELLQKGVASYAKRFDAAFGGFGRRPKFPRSHGLSFLLRQWKRGAKQALPMVEQTLTAMARGGMYDHLGGGFHRYATDRQWLLPHFEKMLYDQALLGWTYVEAYQATGQPRYARVAREIYDYVLREMTDPRGGFYSAEDADSEGEEGKFYLWTRAEVLQVLGAADGALFCKLYGVEEGGNFLEEATGKRTGTNVLALSAAPDAATEKRLAAMRVKLLRRRAGRTRPYKDDKILTDWNGLMIWSLARGGRALDAPRYLAAARKAADFLLTTLRTKAGRLLHRYRAGKAELPAYLDDHAYLLLGLVALYEATFEPRWLAEARKLADRLIALFWDAKGQGFLFSGAGNEELIATSKQLYDGARPSGNSVATLALLRLGRLTMTEKYTRHGRLALEHFSGQLAAYPEAFPFMLIALDFHLGPTQEIVLAGAADDPTLVRMRGALARRFLPRAVVAHRPPGKAAEVVALIPFLANQRPIRGKATAYVCSNYVCKLPTHTVEKMVAQVEGED